MNKITLSQTLADNQQLLGKDYVNLGKWTSSPFWGGKKVYLSHDSKTGFTVIQLNMIQFILRRTFGYYACSHLKRIVQKWQVAIRSEVLPPKPIQRKTNLFTLIKQNYFSKDPKYLVDFQQPLHNLTLAIMIIAIPLLFLCTVFVPILRPLISVSLPSCLFTSFLYLLFKIRIMDIPNYWNDLIFEKKIEEIWNRKHPNEAIPSFTVVIGNCSPENAEVICFAESHTDKAFIKESADWINKHFQNSSVGFFSRFFQDSKNDILAIERYLKKFLPLKDVKDPGLIKPNFLTTGWDSEDIKILNSKIFSKFNEIQNLKIKILSTLESCIDHEYPNSASLSKAMDSLNKFFLDHADYYFFRYPKINNKLKANEFCKLANEDYAKFKNGRLSKSKFYLNLCKILNQYTEDEAKAVYRNLTLRDSYEISRCIDRRNNSLAATIDNLRKVFKRVFVIAGSNHLLPLDTKVNEQVRKELSKHKHIIILKRRYYEKKFPRGIKLIS